MIITAPALFYNKDLDEDSLGFDSEERMMELSFSLEDACLIEPTGSDGEWDSRTRLCFRSGHSITIHVPFTKVQKLWIGTRPNENWT